MAIGFDASSIGGLNASSWSHTVGGSNRILFVGEFDDTGGSNLLTAVKWNTSESFTKITEIQAPGDRWVSIWYLINPTATTANISLTTTAGAFKGSASSYTGAQQSGVPDAFDSTSQTPSSLGGSDSINLTVGTNAWIVTFFKENAGIGVTWTNATERQSSAFGDHIADSNAALTGSQTTTASYVGPTRTAMVSASFLPSGGAAAATFQPRRQLIGIG